MSRASRNRTIVRGKKGVGKGEDEEIITKVIFRVPVLGGEIQIGARSGRVVLWRDGRGHELGILPKDFRLVNTDEKKEDEKKYGEVEPWEKNSSV